MEIGSLKSLRNLKGSLKNKKCRHSRVGGNFVWYLKIVVKTICCLVKPKIPACAGMTAFVGFQAAYGLDGLDLAGGAVGGGVADGGDFADDHADGELVVFELQNVGRAVCVGGAADVPAQLV